MVSNPGYYGGSYYGNYPMSGYETSIYGTTGYYGSSGSPSYISGGYGTGVSGAQYVGSIYGANSLNGFSPFGGMVGGLSMGYGGFVGRQFGNSYSFPYAGGYPFYEGYGYGSVWGGNQPCSCDTGCASRDNNVCCVDIDVC